jgi:hypothetical protein
MAHRDPIGRAAQDSAAGGREVQAETPDAAPPAAQGELPQETERCPKT